MPLANRNPVIETIDLMACDGDRAFGWAIAIREDKALRRFDGNEFLAANR